MQYLFYRFYYGINELDKAEAIEQYQNLVQRIPPQLSARNAFYSPSLRKEIALGAVVSASQIFCGSVVAASYSTRS